MIKIAPIYRAPSGTIEPFRFEFTADDFEIPELKGDITVMGQLLRVEEGVMMLIAEVDATQETFCARCAKPLKLKMDFEQSEWLFYEESPHEDDDENEWLKLDTHRLELDEKEPIRQDLLLNLEHVPRCKKLCKKFEESKLEEPKGVKALSGLKDLLS
ncbi:MAG: YceD family protein [Patescibacteria group bacterium]